MRSTYRVAAEDFGARAARSMKEGREESAWVWAYGAAHFANRAITVEARQLAHQEQIEQEAYLDAKAREDAYAGESEAEQEQEAEERFDSQADGWPV